MEKSEQINQQPTNKQGLAIAALVAGIISILTALIWFVSIPLAVVAVIFGALSTKSAKRGMAIAGIVTGSIGVVLSIIITYVVLFVVPNQINSMTDSVRKNDIQNLVANINQYRSENNGKLPKTLEVPTDNVELLKVSNYKKPTSVIAAYVPGEDCSGARGDAKFSVSIEMSNGEIYCQDGQ